MNRGPWRRAVPVALAVWLGVGSAIRESRADTEPAPLVPIALVVEACPSSWDRDVRRAVAVEIGDARVARRAGTARDSVVIRCDAQHVLVVARGSDDVDHLDRTLSLADLPAETAPRVVALAAVELLATLDPALRRRLTAQAAPARVAPSREAPPRAGGDRRLSLTAGGVYRTFLSPGGLHAWGGMLDARRAFASGSWSSAVGFEAAAAERSTTIGQTSALLLSVRASAGMRARLAGDRLVLMFDLGARGGVARLAGRSDDGDVLRSTALRPWAGPVATLRAQLGGTWFCTELTAEGGWAAVSANGLVNDVSSLAASGPWLALSLGFGLWR